MYLCLTSFLLTVPNQAEFSAVFCTITQIKINQILIGDTRFRRHSLKVNNNILFQANRNCLFFPFLHKGFEHPWRSRIQSSYYFIPVRHLFLCSCSSCRNNPNNCLFLSEAVNHHQGPIFSAHSEDYKTFFGRGVLGVWNDESLWIKEDRFGLFE